MFMKAPQNKIQNNKTKAVANQNLKATPTNSPFVDQRPSMATQLSLAQKIQKHTQNAAIQLSSFNPNGVIQRVGNHEQHLLDNGDTSSGDYEVALISARRLDSNTYFPDSDSTIDDDLDVFYGHFVGGMNPRQVSLINYGGVNKEQAGTWVMAKLKNADHPAGSAPGSEPIWYKKLHQRRNSTNSVVYIRGHLLNQKLGGPGKAYNLVPLTQMNDVGANDSNGIHSSQFETVVKGYYNDSTSVRNRLDYIRYNVSASYDGHEFRDIVNDQAQVVGNLQKMVENKWVANEDNLTKLTAQYQEHFKGYDIRIMQDALSAIGANQPKTVGDVRRLCAKNLNLMMYEETAVPTSISIELSVKDNFDEDEKIISLANGSIDIKLPSDLKAKFKEEI